MKQLWFEYNAEVITHSVNTEQSPREDEREHLVSVDLSDDQHAFVMETVARMHTVHEILAAAYNIKERKAQANQFRSSVVFIDEVNKALGAFYKTIEESEKNVRAVLNIIESMPVPAVCIETLVHHTPEFYCAFCGGECLLHKK